MWSIVGLNSAFIASGFILSMPCEDHFTKSTLQKRDKNKESESYRLKQITDSPHLASVQLKSHLDIWKNIEKHDIIEFTLLGFPLL